MGSAMIADVTDEHERVHGGRQEGIYFSAISAFQDGHATGIFAFEYLRSICECDECRPKAT